MRSVCSILADHSTDAPDQALFVFQESRWTIGEQRTYSQLAMVSAAAAGVISDQAQPGDRALLLFPTGAAFWEAFFGCLACGVIAVPLKIPNLLRDAEGLARVCRDCTPAILITDDKTAELLKGRIEQLPQVLNLPIISSEQWRGQHGSYKVPQVDRDSIALLQYTSGSTADPKGVQISHGNLVANMEMIRDRMNIQTGSESGVTWLPHYHDMGLVGGYLTPLFTKNSTVCLPPEMFAVRPVSWLRMISESKASICGGPTFAYQLCVDKISDDQMEGIDLSSWRVAFVGAERIRAETLELFTQKFDRAGFQSKAVFPCYGLAEATLMVTGGPVDRRPVVRQFDAASYPSKPVEFVEDSTTASHVGCGRVSEGCSVAVIDPETCQPLAQQMIGEVAICGASVTSGYFHRPDLTQQTFCELTIDGQPGRYLRTGDLGFLWNGELFITGRMKEIIIVRGRNLNPEDLERAVDQAHESLQSGGTIAFSVEQSKLEALIIAAELKRSAEKQNSFEAIEAAVRSRIAEAFGINPAEILILKAGTIPRTSSGKPKRLEMRDRFLDETINELIVWRSRKMPPCN